MDKVKTATGKEFDTDYMVEHEPTSSIYLRIVGEEFNAVKTVFSNPEETSELTYVGRTYDGFTRMDRIEQQSDAVKMRLMK